jgi:hypothetical protein
MPRTRSGVAGLADECFGDDPLVRRAFPVAGNQALRTDSSAMSVHGHSLGAAAVIVLTVQDIAPSSADARSRPESPGAGCG